MSYHPRVFFTQSNTAVLSVWRVDASEPAVALITGGRICHQCLMLPRKQNVWGEKTCISRLFVKHCEQTDPHPAMQRHLEDGEAIKFLKNCQLKTGNISGFPIEFNILTNIISYIKMKLFDKIYEQFFICFLSNFSCCLFKRC